MVHQLYIILRRELYSKSPAGNQCTGLEPVAWKPYARDLTLMSDVNARSRLNGVRSGVHFTPVVPVVPLIKYARLTAMTHLCRRHSTAACWEPLWFNAGEEFFKRPRNSFHSNDAFVSDKSRSMSRLETVWPSACTKFKIAHQFY